MFAETDVGPFQREGVRDPENDESEDGGAGGRNEAIRKNAEPGVQLAHFFPPLVIDSVGAEPAQGDEQNNRDDGIPKASAAGLAAGDLTMTEGRIQGCSNCTLSQSWQHYCDGVGMPRPT